MVIGHHLIWTLYGWWLPNDPRGSGSAVVREDVLAELGALHFGRKRVQPSGAEVRAFYEQAAARLKHPLLTLAPGELAQVGAVLGETIGASGYTCWAAAVMPDHVHLVIRKHRDKAEAMIEKIQAESRARLIAAGLRVADHPVWTRGGWKVFLDDAAQVERTVGYVELNPVKAGLGPQRWGWVCAYDGWPSVRRR